MNLTGHDRNRMVIAGAMAGALGARSASDALALVALQGAQERDGIAVEIDRSIVDLRIERRFADGGTEIVHEVTHRDVIRTKSK